MSDGDRLLKLIGIALVAFILFAVLTGVLAAMNPDIGLDEAETVWTADRANETHLLITYEDGPAIPADELVVSVDGYDRHGLWSGEVRPGDESLVRVGPNSRVRLYRLDERGPRTLLDEWKL